MNYGIEQTIIRRFGGKGSGWFAPPLGVNASESLNKKAIVSTETIAKGKLNDSKIEQVNNMIKERGFYLESYHKIWLKEGKVRIENAPINWPYQSEYKPSLTVDNPTVQKMISEFNQGHRLPIIEGFYTSNNKIKISDGQHRWMAYKAMKNKTIPIIITNE